MGLLMVATMGMVTSCKDYDDDIDANKAEIENLKTTLSSLQADLESCKSDCEAQIQAAVSDYTAKIAALKAELETEIANKADQSTVDALESKIDSLQQDYDAKISALQAKDEALQEAIDEVKALAESKVDQSEYDEFVAKYNDALAEWTTWRGGVNDQIDALTKKTNNLSDSLSTAYGKLAAHDLAIKELQDQVDALNKFKESQESKNEELEAADKKQNERIDSLKNAMEQAIQDLKDQIAQAQFGMTLDELKDYMNETYVSITDFNTELATMNTFINKQLTSLVLKPTIYVDGIEGIEYPVLRDYATYSVQKEEIDEVWTVNNDNKVNSSNGGVATYHVNPNICDLTGYSIDFYGNDPVTRAGIQYVNPTYTSYDALAEADPTAFSAGLLSVPFTVNFTEYDKTVKEGKTPMIALQMSKVTEDGTRTVTSDYALLSLNIYKSLILADNATQGGDDHIQQEATDLQHNHMFGQGEKQVVKNLAPEDIEPTHEITDSTYDINKIVETHYTSADNTVDQKMTKEAMDALGLSYEYKVIKYTLTGRTISEDQYVSLKDGVLTVVRSINGKTVYPEGHMPIVRVTLVDGDGNVLKVGYIKFRIAGSTTPVVTENLDETQNVDCDGVVFSSLKVSKVVEDLATDPRIDMSVAAFNQTYQLVMNTDNTVNQYEATTSNGKTTYSEADPEIGTITINGDYFNWTLPATYTDTMSVDADGKNLYPIVTYIKYSNGGKAEAYAKIVIPAGSITKPVVSLDNSSKVLARWYKENEMTQEGTGDELTEIHITPEVVGQPGADDEIYYNLNEGFLSQKPAFKFQNTTFSSDLITDYKYVFIMKPGVDEWVVTGRSGSTYKLTVNEAGTEVLATTLTTAGTYAGKTVENEVIATLSGSHNQKLTYNEKAQEKYLASYDILNKNGHKELADGETLKLYIGVQAIICNKPVDAGQFTARVLRPVDLNTTSQDAGVDATDNGYYADIMKLFEDPSDWRDQWKDSYWTYYGIDSVQADLDHAYTDAALTESQRVAYEPGFDNADQIEQLANTEKASIHLEFVEADDTHKYGQILYTANGATIGAFHVYVPITISYDWGYKVNMGYARIDIANTLNNAKNR